MELRSVRSIPSSSNARGWDWAERARWLMGIRFEEDAEEAGEGSLKRRRLVGRVVEVKEEKPSMARIAASLGSSSSSSSW